MKINENIEFQVNIKITKCTIKNYIYIIYFDTKFHNEFSFLISLYNV